jgi:type I restriction enzyme, S subunit
MSQIQHLGDGATFDEVSKRDLEAFELPVPPIVEQERLVKRIEALSSRAQELRGLNSSLTEDSARILSAEYIRISRDAPIHRFGEIAKLLRRHVTAIPKETYLEMGVRSFGRGTFHKPALTQQLGRKRIFRIKSRDLVFMNVFAWEGAIAVAKPEDDDRVGSHRFMTHEIDKMKATPEFLCYHFLTDQGLEQIRAASPGSAGRNRTLGITKLHAITIPVPPIEAQQRFSRLFELKEKLRRLQLGAEVELTALPHAVLAKAFRGL